MDHQSDVQKQPLQEQHQRLSESQNIVYIHQEPQGYKNHNYSYQHDRTHLTGDQHFQSHNANFEHFENQYPFVTNGNFSPSNTSTTLIPNSLDLGKSKNYQTGVTNSGYSSENGSVSTNRHQKTDATMQFTSGNFQNLDLQSINYQQASPYFLQNLGNQYQLNENLVPTYQSSGSSPSSDESSVSNASQLQYSSDSSTISNNQFEFPVPISNTAQIGQNFQFQQKDFLDNYMAVMHQDTQVPRCDSSKSEAEESTCSSLSSGSNESQSENENVLHLPVLVNPLTSNNGNCNIINPYQSNVQNTASTYPNSLEQNETNEITNNYTNQAGQNVLKYNNFNTTISNQQYLANENNSGINNGMPPNNQVNNLVVMLPNHLNKDIQNCLQTGQPILQNPSSQEMVNSSKFVIQNPKVNSQNIFGLINVTTPVIQDKLVTPVKVNQMIKVNNCGTHESCHRNEHNSDAGNKTNNSNCGLCNEGNNKKFGVAPNCDEDTHLHSSNHHSNGEVTDTCTSHIQNTSDSSVIDSNFVQTNLSVKCRENENSCAMLFKETSDKSITQSVGNVNSSVFDSNSVYLVKGDESNVINSYCYGDSSTKSCSSGNSGMQTFPVPTGWNRLLVDGSIIYLSPSNVALNSIEQIKMYLQTAGTCKCGLECPVNCDSMFNFNPKVISRPWDASESEKTRLCNHKRKASLSGISAAGDDKNVKLSRKKGYQTKKVKLWNHPLR
ncbi:hypothetical protein RUM43_000666 [Polyplax serrata]|uniref:MBD domain-containing protein n=1 Tax=Polyplax serrata TaxID=468196 RepID=A0AAN8SDN9_POLSC